MEEMLKIGIIVKPQGVRGELKVQPLTDNVERFKKLKTVIVDDVTVNVLKVRTGAGEVFITLSGVQDRNTAETFRSKFLYVKREDAVPLDADSYFITDIVGCSLSFENGQPFAEVTEVTEAKTDYLTATAFDGKTVRFPFLKDLLIKIDVNAKSIILKEKRFYEVAVYED